MRHESLTNRVQGAQARPSRHVAYAPYQPAVSPIECAYYTQGRGRAGGERVGRAGRLRTCGPCETRRRRPTTGNSGGSEGATPVTHRRHVAEVGEALQVHLRLARRVVVRPPA